VVFQNLFHKNAVIASVTGLLREQRNHRYPHAHAHAHARTLGETKRGWSGHFKIIRFFDQHVSEIKKSHLSDQLSAAVHAQVEIGFFAPDSHLATKGISLHYELGL